MGRFDRGVLRARFHFRVRSLVVARELLGSKNEFSFDDKQMVLVFPLRPADLDEESVAENTLLAPDLFEADDPAPELPGSRIETSASVVPSKETARVDVARIDVYGQTSISARSFDGEDVREPADEALAFLREAFASAHSALGILLGGERVLGNQHWLGLSSEAPPGLGRAELVDVDANRQLPVWLGLRPQFTLLRISPKQVLERERLGHLLERVQESSLPSLPDRLLADAFFYAFDAEPLDNQRGLLTAAIACEVKVKYRLRDLVEPGSAELLEVLLESGPIPELASAAEGDTQADAVSVSA